MDQVMNCDTALIVTVAGLLISLVISAYAQYRLLEKLAGKDKEPK